MGASHKVLVCYSLEEKTIAILLLVFVHLPVLVGILIENVGTCIEGLGLLSLHT